MTRIKEYSYEIRRLRQGSDTIENLQSGSLSIKDMLTVFCLSRKTLGSASKLIAGVDDAEGLAVNVMAKIALQSLKE